MLSRFLTWLRRSPATVDPPLPATPALIPLEEVSNHPIMVAARAREEADRFYKNIVQIRNGYEASGGFRGGLSIDELPERRPAKTIGRFLHHWNERAILELAVMHDRMTASVVELERQAAAGD